MPLVTEGAAGAVRIGGEGGLLRRGMSGCSEWEEKNEERIATIPLVKTENSKIHLLL